MITNQVQICINLAHAKTELKKAKALLREIINAEISVTDSANISMIKEMQEIDDDIRSYLKRLI